MGDEMRVSCRRKEVPIILETEEGEKRLVLREMTGKMRDEYLQGISGKMRYDSQGKPSGLKSFKDLQADLLSFCLYDGDDCVKIEEIRELPASAQKELFVKAQELNALDEKDLEEAAKNA